MSVKIVLRKDKKSDGTYPLAIRITKDRKSSYIFLEHSITESQWDKSAGRVKKSHPNHARLNNYLLKKLAEATNTALEIQTEKAHVTSRAVRQKLKPTVGDTFFTQADIYLENLKATGNYNVHSADKPRIKHFKEFLNGQDIAFSDITVALLDRFKNYLRRPDKDGITMSERTAINHFVVIRSIFSQAIKGNSSLEKYYPFGRGKFKIKFPESIKIGLSPEEVKRLEDAELDKPYHNHCRNLWLFSFYFAGMRIGDVLGVKWSDFKDDRFYYAMNKNSKVDSLKVSPKVKSILAQYEDQKENADDLVFPELRKVKGTKDKFLLMKTIATATNRIDKTLREFVANKAEINTKLTMHIARHTFGNISGDKIPIQMLQKLYRHSSITTTIGYQSNFIHKDVDDALDAVLNTSTPQ